MILKQIDPKCAICGHGKCQKCREVSFSNLACCRCRARAITRLQQLLEGLKDVSNENREEAGSHVDEDREGG
jgi:hypothetical protein